MGERIKYGDITDKRELVGKRISMYSGNRDSSIKMWTATVKSINKDDPGMLNLADNITYNADGGVRANGARKRYGIWEPAHRYFEYVDADVPQPEVTIPKTYGELNDSHIGMRFKVHGIPVMEQGTYEGGLEGTNGMTMTAFWTHVDIGSHKNVNVYSRGNSTKGYYADSGRKVEYLSGAPEKSELPGLTQEEIDAKLVAYANQRMSELVVGDVEEGERRNLFVDAENAAYFHVGEAFLKIYKELNGEA